MEKELRGGANPSGCGYSAKLSIVNDAGTSNVSCALYIQLFSGLGADCMGAMRLGRVIDQRCALHRSKRRPHSVVRLENRGLRLRLRDPVMS